MAIAGRTEQATEDNWMFPPPAGWTIEQVTDLELPFDWELVDGVIVARGQRKVWHNRVRDSIARRLEDARVTPYAVLTEQCVLVDPYNAPRPDVIVYDPTGLNVFELECIPVDRVALAVEVVSPGSRQDDRVRKPALFAESKIPYYWRAELGKDDGLSIHEYWLHHERHEYIPAVTHPVHTKRLVTEQPFAVEFDVSALLEL
ncbi:Uma2 family endonuclease [Streptomyces sp. NBC_01180]|uniref:Uma2 family endonuclease n=1 Tax=Streptomyces sp. NBC_01180 TaxID=2903763 RepID=UPI0038668F64|nr:Uma2 family endonuclease [Streptomyces sp. NBC_01180]